MKKTPLIMTASLFAVAIPAQAAFTLLDNFEGHTLGNDVDTAGGWTEFGTAGGSVVADPDNAGNQVAQLTGAANNAGYQLALGGQTISDGSEATIFFRYRTTGAFSVYLTDKDAVGANWWENDDEVGLYNKDTGGTSDIRAHHNTAVQTSLNQNQWYNVWIHVQNTTTPSEPLVAGSERYFIYIDGVKLGPGDGNGDDSYDTRSWDANVPDLDSLFFVSNYGVAGGMIDDIYIDNTGLNLVNPAAVPEPSSTTLLGLGGLALILRRRK